MLQLIKKIALSSCSAGLLLALALPGCTLPWQVSRRPGSAPLAMVPAAVMAAPAPKASVAARSGRALAPQAELPESRMLAVENITQKPQLPNGCEATSLAILLNYLGYSADKQDLAYNYLPLQPFEYADGTYYGGNPDYVYVGNPGGNGYYCYARPLAMAANQYLANQASPYQALDCTGLTEEDLVALVASGHPVIVWKTIDHAAPRSREHLAWTLPVSGELYAPLVNLHVVVLCGYDTESFYFCDPLQLAPTMGRALFMDLFVQMGSRAVAIF